MESVDKRDPLGLAGSSSFSLLQTAVVILNIHKPAVVVLGTLHRGSQGLQVLGGDGLCQHRGSSWRKSSSENLAINPRSNLQVIAMRYFFTKFVICSKMCRFYLFTYLFGPIHIPNFSLYQVMSDNFPNKTQQFKIGYKYIVFVGLKTTNLFLAHHFSEKYPKVGYHHGQY